MMRLPSRALALFALSLLPNLASGQEKSQIFARTNPITEAVKKTKAAIVEVRVPRPNGAKDMIGTGVVVGEDGTIITNQHVVGSADKVIIRMADGGENWATVLVGESKYDLAILKLKSAGKMFFLKPAPVGDLMVGEVVIAVGNPLGYANTVSQGIISALDREITMPTGDAIAGLIQTDASINPGNSGGPLLNINGEFIGVNVALRQDARGIAFAINAGTVENFLRRHLNAGKVAGVDHGLKLGQKILAPTGDNRQRVVVRQVAAEAAVQTGDEILAVGPRLVANGFDVERALWDKRPGEQVQFKVVRQGRELTVTLTLSALEGAGTATTAGANSSAPPGGIVARESVPASDRR